MLYCLVTQTKIQGDYVGSHQGSALRPAIVAHCFIFKQYEEAAPLEKLVALCLPAGGTYSEPECY